MDKGEEGCPGPTRGSLTNEECKFAVVSHTNYEVESYKVTQHYKAENRMSHRLTNTWV